MFIIPYFLTLPAHNATNWVTQAGALTTSAYTGQAVTLRVQALTEAGRPVTYVLSAGTLPPGLTLNAKNGLLTGVLDDTQITEDSIYVFTISALD